MQTKRKITLIAILSVIFAIATTLLCLQPSKLGATNGIYDGNFTAYAQTDESLGEIKGMTSADGNYLLLATSLKISNFEDYSAVGYEIEQDGVMLTGDNLCTPNYYTGITFRTGDDTTKTLTMQEIFGDSATGMIVAEIAFSDCADYTIKPFLLANDGTSKTYGTTFEGVREKNDFKFEAECSVVTADNKVSVGTEGKGVVATNNPSGGMFVSGIKNAVEAKLEFNVTSSGNAKATMVACMGLREWQLVMSRVFTLTVNGQEVAIGEDVIFPVADGVKFWDWTEVEICKIDLVKGANTIAFEKKAGLGDGVGNGLNFDYITLTTAANLQWTSEVEKGHTFDSEWTLQTAPTYENVGVVQQYCSTCRATQTAGIPAVSVENGYVKGATTIDTIAWTYNYNGYNVNITLPNNELEVSKYFIAEINPFTEENGGDATGIALANGANGIFYEKSYGKTFKLTVNVKEATTVKFYLTANARYQTKTANSLVTEVTVNGSTDGVTRIDSEMPITGEGSAAWNTKNAVDLLIAKIDLEVGTNVITFTRGTSSGNDNNINIAGVVFEATTLVNLGETSTAKYAFTVANNNPFAAENGGNAGGLSVVNHATYGKFYEQSQLKTFTITINVEEATTVKFYLIANARYQTVSANGLVTEITLNGSTDGVTRVDSAMPITGEGGAAWNTANSAEVLFATLELKAGTNVITFTRGTGAGDTCNINIAGVAFVATTEVKLGAAE